MEQSAALDKKERIAQNRAFRKPAAIVFFGICLYLVLNQAFQYIYGAFIMSRAGAGAAAQGPADMGNAAWAAVAAVCTAALLAWFYFGLQKNRALVFPGQTEARAVFGESGKMRPIVLVLAVCLFLGLQFLFVLLDTGFEAFFRLFGLTLSGSAAMETDYSLSLSLILYAAVVGPFCEELVFRGFVMQGLKQYGKLFAIVTSAFCFALMHGDFQQTLFTFFAGLIFGYVAMEYSIVWSFLLHVFNNYVLGDLFAHFMGSLSETAQDWVAIGVMALTLGFCALWTVRHREAIGTYRQTFRTPKGTYPRTWCSLWLILFVLCELWSILHSVRPLP